MDKPRLERGWGSGRGWWYCKGRRDAGDLHPGGGKSTPGVGGEFSLLFSLRFQVAAVAGVYEVLNELGFPELESLEGKALCTLRGRWQAQAAAPRPFRGDFV